VSDISVRHHTVIPPGFSEVKKHNQERLRQLEALRRNIARLYDDQLKDLEQATKHAEAVGNAVDTVKTLIDIGSSLSGAARAAKATIGMKGKMLKKLNVKFYKELKHACTDIGKDMVEDQALEAVAEEGKEKDGVLWAIGRVAANTLLSYDSPSFWAWTFVQLRNGRTWSEAVSTSPEDYYIDSRNKLLRAKADALRNIDKRIWAIKQALR
jgi:hypothetical protein